VSSSDPPAAPAPAPLHREALEHLRAGRAAQAEALCRAALQADAADAEAAQLLGVIALQHNKYAAAVPWFERALQARPDHAQAHNNLGTALQALGRTAAAIAAFRRALALRPAYAEAYNNLGSALLVAGEAAEAERALGESLRLRPGHPRALYNLGNALAALGRLEAAAESYARALQAKPDFAEAVNNLGGTLYRLGRHAEAERLYQRAFALRPQAAQAQFNLALLAELRDDPAEALERYRAAAALEPGNPDAHNNLGNVLRRQGRLREAEQAYRAALAAAPGHAAARNNLGNVLRDQGRLDEAGAWYASALGGAPGEAGAAEACVNMAGIVRERGRPQEALDWLQRALTARPGFAEAYLQLGNLMQELGRREDAVAAYRRALELRADYPEALAGLLHQSQHLCDWRRFDELAARLRGIVAERQDARVPPFAALALDFSPAEQLRCATSWSRLGFAPLAALRGPLGLDRAAPRAADGRIRVGYLSGDFRAHPVAYLATGLLELHDRGRFEVLGYGTGPDDGSAERARMIAACDRYTELRGVAYEAAARGIHGDGVDILVDLTGYTQWGRAGILALRPAPVQVNFLGFPGTLGAPWMDYLIADDVLVPAGAEAAYAEKIVRLPLHQPNDHRRPRPGAATRAAQGLPEAGFVFCCFNQTFKILPRVFDVWMRLLRELPGSVLWLAESNGGVAANLRREAAARGVDPARLVFAPWIQGDLARHYARVALADLFLDTAPFNANATASDALWCGVPVLTCAGETFASRAAASLLTAAGLAGLVTRSLEEYEARALQLARTPALLAGLRAALAGPVASSRLFDAARFARSLEAAFEAMHRVRIEGRAPSDLRIPAS
jgi:predicted O-linked N-acetylglucosamine transferase (SPINDLY family)